MEVSNKKENQLHYFFFLLVTLHASRLKDSEFFFFEDPFVTELFSFLKKIFFKLSSQKKEALDTSTSISVLFILSIAPLIALFFWQLKADCGG